MLHNCKPLILKWEKECIWNLVCTGHSKIATTHRHCAHSTILRGWRSRRNSNLSCIWQERKTAMENSHKHWFFQAKSSLFQAKLIPLLSPDCSLPSLFLQSTSSPGFGLFLLSIVQPFVFHFVWDISKESVSPGNKNFLLKLQKKIFKRSKKRICENLELCNKSSNVFLDLNNLILRWESTQLKPPSYSLWQIDNLYEFIHFFIQFQQVLSFISSKILLMPS